MNWRMTEPTRDSTFLRSESYLGDGVYASFDGYQIWLRVDDREIALEPAVYDRLVEYAGKVFGIS